MIDTDRAHWLMPAAAYFSDEWFAREQERLFSRCWTMVGTLDDLAAGPAVVCVAGHLVEVGAEDGSLHICGNDGARADQWGGLVFVQLDPQAGPLDEWLGAFPSLIGGFRPETLSEVARHRFVLNANWKFFVENHIDVYHLWFLHDESLGVYDHALARWQSEGPHWVFYEPPRAGVDIHDPGFWRGMVPLPGIGEDRWGSGAHLVFPNLTLATGAGFFMTYQCSPIGPDRSLVDLRVRAAPGADPSDMMAISQRIIEGEDGAACEALQAAVRSPWFEVGPLAADHELPITRFHREILERLS